MPRFATALAFCTVLLVGGVALAADEDPIAAKLATAKVEYEKSMDKARIDLLAELKKKMDVAQKAGDPDALERVEKEVKAFEVNGTLPKSVSVIDYMEAQRVARARLGVAYDAAVKDYTIAGKKELAKAAQTTWAEIKNEGVAPKQKTTVPDDGLPAGTKLRGTSSWSSGPPGKRVSNSGKAEWNVTKRKGNEITLEDPKGYIFEGTFVDGVLKVRIVDAPESNKKQIDNAYFLGTFDKQNETLNSTGRNKTDASAVTEVKLKVVKE